MSTTQVSATSYAKTYTSFGGCDIVASFNGRVIGELQAITYSVSREKAPIYTMGSAEPRSFSRGKRGIAGSLAFIVFNRDALIDEFSRKSQEDTKTPQIQKFKMNDYDYTQEVTGDNYVSIDDWDAQMTALAGGNSTTTGSVSNLTSYYNPKYADEILPFDITITMANEYGQRAMLVIYGVELLNEGSGYSIDSVTTEKAYTFVARRLDPMKSLDAGEDATFSSSW